MQNKSKSLIRKYKEKINLGISSGILGLVFIVISFFFIPLMKEETRRFGEDVVIYDYFAMTIFHIFIVFGLLLLILGIVLVVLYFLKFKKVNKNENQNRTFRKDI